jgi:hypothetical protein
MTGAKHAPGWRDSQGAEGTPPLPFAPPEVIAALRDAKPKGRGWKDGACPICNERGLSIWWERRLRFVKPGAK